MDLLLNFCLHAMMEKIIPHIKEILKSNIYIFSLYYSCIFFITVFPIYILEENKYKKRNINKKVNKKISMHN